jgi:valyl-tRNA synthetase
MDVAIAEAHAALDQYRFNDAAQTLYHFVWGELCDWYIELAKLSLQGDDAAARRATQHTLASVLRGALVALHPIMPFVTEEIAQALPGGDGRLLLAGAYPKPGPALDAESAREMGALVELVSKIRQARGELGLPPASRLSVAFPHAAADFVGRHAAAIASLARTAPPALSDDAPSPTASVLLVHGWSVRVELDDPAFLGEELRRLEKEIARIEKDLEIAAKKLGNPSFVERAKPEVVQAEREKQVRLGEEAASVRERLERLRRATPGTA